MSYSLCSLRAGLVTSLAFALTALAGCQSHPALTDTDTQGRPPRALAPETAVAGSFADSLSHAPSATNADQVAAKDYAANVAVWYGSAMPAALKYHPLATSFWKNYRFVLLNVVGTRGKKKVDPADEKTWNGFEPGCAQAVALLTPLVQQQPVPTALQALPIMQTAWDGMATVRHGVERHCSTCAPPPPATNATSSSPAFLIPHIFPHELFFQL